jgi:hypothetical protein
MCALNVYPDHNFLIDCTKTPEWRKVAIDARRSGQCNLVFSAWHFYEYGNGSAYPDNEDVIRFAEELEPVWILERADLQHREFVAVWNQIWSGSTSTFQPICSLAEASAALNRVPVERMARFSIRDYIRSFSAPGALDDMRRVMAEQADVAKSLSAKYAEDRLGFWRIPPLVELQYVAVQLARLNHIVPARVYAAAEHLLRTEPIATQIKCFTYWRCTEYLKAYKTEAAFSWERYTTDAARGPNPQIAALNPNRQIDRHHATVALPYCDVFVTNDGELRRRCDRVKPELRFPTAAVMSSEDFIASLSKRSST